MPDVVDTHTWDTVFVIHYDQANKAIIDQKSSPKSFDFTDSKTSVNLKGKWGDWQLEVGGGAQNLHIKCPIITGSTSGGGVSDASLNDSYVVVELKLNKVPNPEAPVDPTAKPNTGKTYAFKPNPQGTHDDPAVSIVSSYFPHVTGLLLASMPTIFATYLSTNLSEFNHAFAIFRLGETADKGYMQWLKPTHSSYACGDAAVNPKLSTSAFAVLSMTENRPVSALAQQSVDLTIFESLTGDENSAFAISGPRFVEKMLLPAAKMTIQDSDVGDFVASNDGLTVKNRNKITWGNFQLDNGDIVSPSIKAGNFQLTLFQNSIELQVTGAQFNWPSWHGPGDIIVSMNITQYVSVELKTRKDGKKVLMPSPKTGLPTITATVTTTEGVEIFDICIGIAGSIAGAVLGSVIGSVFDAVEAVGSQVGDEVAIEIETQALQEAEEQAGAEAVEAAEEEAGNAAAEAVENPSYLQRFANSIRANKFRMIGGMIGAAVGAQPSLIAEYMKLVAKNDVDNIPPFNDFAANCTGAIHFSETSTWDLESAGLQGALVLGGKLS